MAGRGCMLGSPSDSTNSPSITQDTSGSSLEGAYVAGLPLLDHLRAWLVSVHQDLSRTLKPRQRNTLIAQLERARVELVYEAPPIGQYRQRQHMVVGVSRLGADRQAVLFPGEEASRRGLLTIAEYFREVHGLTLKYPSLNCVELHPSVFVPVEVEEEEKKEEVEEKEAEEEEKEVKEDEEEEEEEGRRLEERKMEEVEDIEEASRKERGRMRDKGREEEEEEEEEREEEEETRKTGEREQVDKEGRDREEERREMEEEKEDKLRKTGEEKEVEEGREIEEGRQVEEGRKEDKLRKTGEEKEVEEGRQVEEGRKEDKLRKTEEEEEVEEGRQVEEGRKEDNLRKTEEEKEVEEGRQVEEGRKEDNLRKTEEEEEVEEGRQVEEGRKEDNLRKTEEEKDIDKGRKIEEGRKLEGKQMKEGRKEDNLRETEEEKEVEEGGEIEEGRKEDKLRKTEEEKEVDKGRELEKGRKFEGRQMEEGRKEDNLRETEEEKEVEEGGEIEEGRKEDKLRKTEEEKEVDKGRELQKGRKTERRQMGEEKEDNLRKTEEGTKVDKGRELQKGRKTGRRQMGEEKEEEKLRKTEAETPMKEERNKEERKIGIGRKEEEERDDETETEEEEGAEIDRPQAEEVEEVQHATQVEDAIHVDQGKHFFHIPATLHTWALYSYAENTTNNQLATFLIHLKQAGRTRGVEVAGPVQLRLPAARCQPGHNPLTDLQDLTTTYPGLQMVMVVVPDRYMYGRVKVVGDLCLGVATQCVYPRTVQHPRPAALGSLLAKINAKIGGCQMRGPRVAALPHLAPSLMVMGLHHHKLHHTNAGPAQGRGLMVGAVVASANLSSGQYLTEVQTQPSEDSAIADLTNMTRRLLECLTGQYRRPVPEQIVVYSDGVQKSQVEEERRAVTRGCHLFMASYSPHITWVEVYYRSLRSWPTTPAEPQSRSGFRLRSQHCSGRPFNTFIGSDGKSWLPTYYGITHGPGAIPVGAVERLSAALCHLPATALPKPLPCPLIYAHLAARRCRLHMRTLGENWTLRDYKELQRDVMRLVGVDVTNPVAHQPYYL
ncbi:trichohyalin-like isoform X16 [Eriocheir sinensis]|uniref:trichohyalin-like isoform X16 n=1 Tax=Eriocheir sinensis TaxID=95602 RepID=UPI0021C83A9E|nr:trichohyalin-like isoform X16 [Eriocheir sinensis]